MFDPLLPTLLVPTSHWPWLVNKCKPCSGALLSPILNSPVISTLCCGLVFPIPILPSCFIVNLLKVLSVRPVPKPSSMPFVAVVNVSNLISLDNNLILSFPLMSFPLNNSNSLPSRVWYTLFSITQWLNCWSPFLPPKRIAVTGPACEGS